MIRKLTEPLFLFLIASMANYGRFFKPLRPFAHSLVNPSWNLPGFFEKNIIFFWCDWIAIAFLFLLTWGKFRWRQAVQSGPNRLLIAFFITAFLSVLASSHPDYLFHYIKLGFLMLPILVYLAITSFDFDRVNLTKKLFQVVLIIALFECLLGGYQFFAQHSLGLKALGEPSLRTKHTWGSSLPGAAPWIVFLKALFPYLTKYNEYIRPCGTFSHTNIFSGFLVFSLLGTHYLLKMAARFRWLLFCSIIIQFLMLVMTHSRAAFIAFAVGSLLWALWTKEKIILYFIATVAVLIFTGVLITQGWEGFSQILIRSTEEERLRSLQVAWEMIKHHPFLGVGFNSYVIEMPHYSDLLWGKFQEPVYVHNIYAFVTAQTGLVGASFFLSFVGTTLYKVWKRRGEESFVIFGTILIGFLIIGLFDFYPILLQPFLYLFLTVAGMINHSGQKASGRDLQSLNPDLTHL